MGVSSYNAIYGSFAALPLFLIWLQTSWAIVLFGGEVAFSWENTETLETQDIDYNKISIRLKKLIVLRIVHLCVSRFASNEMPASDVEIASEIKIPLKIVKILLAKLMECRILLEVNGVTSQGYVPARDIDGLTILTVLTAFEQKGRGILQVGGTLQFEALEESLDEFVKACKHSSGERKFKDI
jgi:membrane protein